MKYFWHGIAVVNTVLFALLVIGLYSGNLSINTDTSVGGDIGVSGMVDANIQNMPPIEGEVEANIRNMR